MQHDILKKYNLPSYLKDKTFAEASKAINDKFMDRNDYVSKQTRNELLSRLAKAQEDLKQSESPSIDMAEGGLALKDATGIAGSAFGLIDPLLDDSTAKSAVGNALQGASAGAMLGPLGAVGGGILGGITSLLSSGKQKKEQEKAMVKAGEVMNKKYYSDFGYGGKKYADGGLMLDDIFKPVPLSVNTSLPFGKGDEVDLPTVQTPNQTGLGKRLDFLGDTVKDSLGSVLRYAPVAVNALQLANLDEPEYEALDRLDNRYERDLVDESALVDRVQQQADNTRNAISNASTGSVGAIRNNLLASQANSNRALSDAMLQAEDINRGENRFAQQFDANIDAQNLRQSNIENELNARNQGVYDSNKSSLIGQIGNDLGNIGREERYKQMVRDMGICYDTRGRYICGTDERVPEDIEVEDMAYGGMSNDDIFSDYLSKMLAKKRNKS